ncbi:MAG: BlaI/MecI/CopY family transcriptional regulator [Sphingomonadaceae bacterium]|nr:BlaI/MecI/CopY family transcriptional regulator [Sphingomonadaceae bacterium]
MRERISESELAVMDVVWSSAPITANAVADALVAYRDWSLQTVKTLLARLVVKGALSTEQDGRRFLYRPLIAREDYRAREGRRFVDRLFEGRVSPLVAQLAEQEALSDSDIAELKMIIDRLGQ